MPNLMLLLLGPRSIVKQKKKVQKYSARGHNCIQTLHTQRKLKPDLRSEQSDTDWLKVNVALDLNTY